MRGKYRRKREYQTECAGSESQVSSATSYRSRETFAPVGVWSKIESWDTLALAGAVLIILVWLAGLFFNHWFSHRLKMGLSIAYTIGAFMAIKYSMADINNFSSDYRRWTLARVSQPCSLFWALTKSVFLIGLYLLIGLSLPCLILSCGWSHGDNEDAEHFHAPFYYQQGKGAYLQRYPNYWAPQWVKISVLPPIDDDRLDIDIGGHQVFIAFKAEYDLSLPGKRLEQLYLGKSREAVLKKVGTRITAITEQRLKATILPEEVGSLKLPLNTSFSNDIDPVEISKLKDSIARAVEKPAVIEGIIVKDVRFPLWF